MNYKGKTSHVADTDVLLPDKLNTFFARFEDNTVPSTRTAPNDWLSFPWLSFSLAYVRKIFMHVNPHKAASPEDILGRVLKPAGWSV